MCRGRPGIVGLGWDGSECGSGDMKASSGSDGGDVGAGASQRALPLSGRVTVLAGVLDCVATVCCRLDVGVVGVDVAHLFATSTESRCSLAWSCGSCKADGSGGQIKILERRFS